MGHQGDSWLDFQKAWLRKGQNRTSDQMLSFLNGSAELKGVVIEQACEMQVINLAKQKINNSHVSFIINQ